jgi:AcrR family transcriptional regulator
VRRHRRHEARAEDLDANSGGDIWTDVKQQRSKIVAVDQEESALWLLTKSNEGFFNNAVGRIAGVTPAETRACLLRAAADVFAARGYEGTRVADIAAAAGVSNGALYAHFATKAELLVAALRAHGRRVLADLVAADLGRPVTELLLQVGRCLPRQHGGDSYLAVEALMAARRDDEVAELAREYTSERADWLAALVLAGQARGEIDGGLSPHAVAHFCLLLAFGSSLLTADMHAVDDAQWGALLARVVSALVPIPPTTKPRRSTVKPPDRVGPGRRGTGP